MSAENKVASIGCASGMSGAAALARDERGYRSAAQVEEVRIQELERTIQVLNQELVAATAEAQAATQKLRQIEQSTFWKATIPLRAALVRFPMLRGVVRKTMKLAYWIVTGQLGKRIRSRYAARTQEISNAATQLSVRPAAYRALPEPSAFNDIGALKARVPAGRQLKEAAVVPFGFVPKLQAEPRIGVMVHVFYPDVLPQICRHIANIPGAPELWMTTDAEEKRPAIDAVMADWPDLKYNIRVWPNRGRDIGPKLFCLGDVHADYDLVLHLHTKKSPHAEAGGDWLSHLLKNLVGSPAVVQSVLAAFEAQPRLGFVFGDHWPPMRSWINWGYDFPAAEAFAARMGFRLHADELLEFPSGSMFWARPAALAPLIALNLQPDDFPEEAGQVDGTPAHSIERLYLRVCESTGHSWLRVIHADLKDRSPGGGEPVAVSSPGQLQDRLRRHQGYISSQGYRPSLRVLTARPESWPWVVAPEFVDRPRLNLFLPALRKSSVFGGIATALEIVERAAAAYGSKVEVRIILTTDHEPLRQENALPGWVVVDGHLEGDAFVERSIVSVPPQTREAQPLPVRPNDIFFASAWWDALGGFSCLDQQHAFFGVRRKLRYFIQDYEPNFSAWSSSWALAENTYRRRDDIVALINSSPLDVFLTQNGIAFDDKFVFQPIWNRSLGHPERQSHARENGILVYWRPSVERNLCPIVAAGLAQWIEADPYGADKWKIYGIGEDGEDVMLTPHRRMQVLGKLTMERYRQIMCNAKVGLSLMLSPHPSYPPLEMSAFGLQVVTNGFGPKDLSMWSPRITSVDRIDPADIAQALTRATRQALDEDAAAEAAVSAPFSCEDELSGLAGWIVEGINHEIGS